MDSNPFEASGTSARPQESPDFVWRYIGVVTLLYTGIALGTHMLRLDLHQADPPGPTGWALVGDYVLGFGEGGAGLALLPSTRVLHVAWAGLLILGGVVDAWVMRPDVPPEARMLSFLCCEGPFFLSWPVFVLVFAIRERRSVWSSMPWTARSLPSPGPRRART